jgi:hypothetical protein
MGGLRVQYMHQASHLMALALFGAMKAANPNTIATSAKTSTKTRNLRKSLVIRSHLLSSLLVLA